MALDVPDVSDLADFTGRAEATFVTEGQTDTALRQATLLFRIATCLTDWPDESDDDGFTLMLARFGVLSMADAIYLSLKYVTTLAKPFQSETIGSYSYSKAANAVANRLPTGVTWFDLASDQLVVCEGAQAIMNSSVQVFEREGVTSHNGRLRKLGPRDFSYSGWPFEVGPPDGLVWDQSGYGSGYGQIAPWWTVSTS